MVLLWLCVGEKKIKKKRGGKNFFLGGEKTYSLVSFGSWAGLQRLARVYVFCAVGGFSLSDSRMLFAGSNFLSAGRNFLLDDLNFLFSGLSCRSAV